jgi:uncharacterized protein YfkK (UPF0435 family)
MNPEDYQKLIAQRNSASIKAANTRWDWAMMLNTDTLKMNDEEIEEHRWKCNDLRAIYLWWRKESFALSEMVKAADKLKNNTQPVVNEQRLS